MDPLRSSETSSLAESTSRTSMILLHEDDKDLESLADLSSTSSQWSACCADAEANLHRCEALALENKLLHANITIIESANEELSTKVLDLESSRVLDQTHFELLAEKCVTLGLEQAGQEDQIVRLSTELQDASRDFEIEVDELRMQIVELQYNLQQEKEAKEKLQIDYLRMCQADAMPRTTRIPLSPSGPSAPQDETSVDAPRSGEEQTIRESAKMAQLANVPLKTYGRLFPIRLHIGLNRS
ncbi:hypothetical protein LTR78_008789 [Recurvomyces mirabilis]|uniref:Uncharacterized protein n=1 Tax=Recurvomyces mirabilis TaxID=574656 RepID=A0AAE0TUD1_9PEZI|nr:hypothetical protein LTR78_008789 [Recurvomyces mirabilis]KAK5160973.1 hypothetical protein LTS14_000767 [Recurvomyces mirabilis]